MNDPCRDLCILARSIAETVRVSGRGCQTDVAAGVRCEDFPSCGCRGACRCCEFISAVAGPGVELNGAAVEPLHARSGFCLRAALAVPVTVTVRLGGMNRTIQGEICLPVEGAMRGSGLYNELVAQANVRVCRGCWIDGRVRLWVDYQAEVHAICLRAVRVPVLGPCAGACAERCHPFFDLPLYPQ